MIFLIDIGNTSIKWGSFNHGKVTLLGHEIYHKELPQIALANQWKKLPKPQSILIANVAAYSTGLEIQGLLKKCWNLDAVFIQENQSIAGISPITTQSILGIDRWLALLAVYQVEKGPFATIGCGTAITIDICQNGTHLGGLIAPGVELMRLSLIEHTAGCRLNPHCADTMDLMAVDTNGAIRTGSLAMATAFIETQIEKIEKKLDLTLKTFIAGGDVNRLMPLFQNPSRFLVVPSLVLNGLALFIR